MYDQLLCEFSAVLVNVMREITVKSNKKKL